MKTKHISGQDVILFMDKKLSKEKQREIEQHFAECQRCRLYSEKINHSFLEKEPAIFPALEPDPYLPTRIRALASHKKTGNSFFEELKMKSRYALSGLVMLTAVLAGIFIGKYTAGQPENGTAELIAYYSEILSQEPLALDFVLETPAENEGAENEN